MLLFIRFVIFHIFMLFLTFFLFFKFFILFVIFLLFFTFLFLYFHLIFQFPFSNALITFTILFVGVWITQQFDYIISMIYKKKTPHQFHHLFIQEIEKKLRRDDDFQPFLWIIIIIEEIIMPETKIICGRRSNDRERENRHIK